MKTRHFLTIATLAVGMAMTSMMMTSCAKEDNPIDNATDGPNVLPVGVILENDVPCQFEDKGEWQNYRVRMQYRVISPGEYPEVYPEVELISVDLRPLKYKLFIPDSVVGYWGEEYKVSGIQLRDFDKDKSGLVELYMNNYIKDIGNTFMLCNNLKKVYLREGVMWISHHAFMKCTSLEELHLYSPWRIEKDAFEGCENLKYVIYHDSRPHNYDGAFPEGVEFFNEKQWKKRNQGSK